MELLYPFTHSTLLCLINWASLDNNWRSQIFAIEKNRQVESRT